MINKTSGSHHKVFDLMRFQAGCTLHFSSKRMNTCVDGGFSSLFFPHPQLTAHCDTPALSADSGGRARSYTWSRWIWLYLCVFYAGCEGTVDPVQLCKIHVLRHILQKINPPTNKFCGKMIFTGDGRTELRITRQKRRATEWVKDIPGPVR